MVVNEKAETLELEIPGEATILELKLMIGSHLDGLESAMQRLVFRGKMLPDDCTLNQAGETVVLHNVSHSA